MKRTLLAALVALTACGSPPPAAPPPPKPEPVVARAAPDPLAADLPLDTRVTKGRLPNGLTYYVMPHKKPEKRAQIWLAVNAGSVLEDDDQQGLAHFVEHMGFNGTKRFPKQALVDFVEKSGVRFGADLNAYTSFDETVYTLQVPTDKPELLAKGIDVLRDWAGDVTFDPEEVEKERGVVLEEWRLGRGAGMRIFDKQAPILLNGSKYAQRLPIGKPEIIKGAPRDAVVRFYKDWYRPDLMAVVAVGDFDAKDVEGRIKTEFGSLPARTSARPRPTPNVPPLERPRTTIETDPEMTSTSVEITTVLPRRPDKSARDFRRTLAERLFHAMLNARLDEVRRLPNAPFLNAFSSSGAFVREADSFRQIALVKDDGVEQGFAALLEEVLRVERHGFTATELERAKVNVLRQAQQAVKEHDTRDGRSYAAEIVRNFMREEAMAGPEAELSLTEKLLADIPLQELNGLGKSLAGDKRVVAVAGPAKMVKPTPESLTAIGSAAAAREIKPYEDAASGALMAQKPTPVPVVKTKTIPEVGVTEWTLKNGARVVLKPTKFANDEIRMTAFSPGGNSLAKDADWETARFAGAIVAQGGLGDLDPTKLRKVLAGKVAVAGARIDELEEGLSGHASPSDLESLLSLVHLSFTAPRKDENAFQAWRTSQLEAAKNRRLSPEGTFADELAIFQSQNHLRRRPPTPESIAKIDLDKALAFYKDRFADAGDFTFVFVGEIDLAKMQPLVETYLGSLPSKGRKESFKDPNVTWPNGVQTKTVTKGTEPKSQVVLTFRGTEKWTRETDSDMRLLGEVLGMRLREVLREDMSGVYGVSANGAILRRPKPEFAFGVRFGCAPENVDKLVKAFFDEVKAIQDKGIGEEYLVKVKELRRRAHETNLKENAFWVRELERVYRYGDDVKEINDIEPTLARVTSANLRAAAKKYVTQKQYILGVLKPEK